MNHQDQDLHPDAELAAALRMIEREPPLDQVDWESLRTNITSRAELPLARRRARSARLARWTRPLVPFAAAASIALTVWVAGPARDFVEQVSGGPDLVIPAVSAEDVFQADLSDREFQLIVSGRADSDALLLLAVDGS